MSLAIGEVLQSLEARIREIEAENPAGFIRRNSFPSNDRPRYQSEGDQRRLEGSESGFSRKRAHSGREEKDDDYEEEDPRPKRSVQSMVCMPPIDTSSRERKLVEMAKTEKQEVTSRNRRMFSNLLGTLSQCKREGDAVSANKQQKKLKEVEERLTENNRLAKEQAIQSKEAKLKKAKEDEEELQKLVRKKAILQYAENKVKHLELMKNAIQTQAKPTIFFLPAKHNVRSLEMLKNSQQTIDRLIASRKDALERDVEKAERPRPPRFSGDEGPRNRGRQRFAVPNVAAKKPRASRSRSRSFSRSGSEDEKEERGEQLHVEVVVMRGDTENLVIGEDGGSGEEKDANVDVVEDQA